MTDRHRDLHDSKGELTSYGEAVAEERYARSVGRIGPLSPPVFTDRRDGFGKYGYSPNDAYERPV